LFDSVAHLGGGFFGERKCQDLLWFYFVVYEMKDFFCYDSRFAGTGAGEDELEAANNYRGFLGGIEGHSDRRLAGGRKKVWGERNTEMK